MYLCAQIHLYQCIYSYTYTYTYVYIHIHVHKHVCICNHFDDIFDIVYEQIEACCHQDACIYMHGGHVEYL